MTKFSIRRGSVDDYKNVAELIRVHGWTVPPKANYAITESLLAVRDDDSVIGMIAMLRHGAAFADVAFVVACKAPSEPVQIPPGAPAT